MLNKIYSNLARFYTLDLQHYYFHSVTRKSNIYVKHKIETHCNFEILNFYYEK